MSDMILFDLDGTLTDSGPGITRCVQYALASFGIEEPDLEKLNCYVGPPLLESFMNFAGLGCEEAQQAITKYRERYEAEGIFENEDEKENFHATDGMCHSGRAAGWLRFPWHR